MTENYTGCGIFNFIYLALTKRKGKYSKYNVLYIHFCLGVWLSTLYVTVTCIVIIVFLYINVTLKYIMIMLYFEF